MIWFWHYALQFSHIAIFAALCFIPRWRHSALIMTAFAVGGFVLLPFYISQAEINNLQYPLLLAGIDLASGYMLFIFGSRGSLRLASIQVAFFFTHFLLFLTVSDVPTAIDRDNYEMVLYVLQLSQIIIVSDGLVEFGEECRYVFGKMADRYLHGSSSGTLSHRRSPDKSLGSRRNSSDNGGFSGLFYRLRHPGLHSKEAQK